MSLIEELRTVVSTDPVEEGAPRSRGEFAKQLNELASLFAKMGSAIDQAIDKVADMDAAAGFLPAEIKGKDGSFMTQNGFKNHLGSLRGALTVLSREHEGASSRIINSMLSVLREDENLDEAKRKSAGTEYRVYPSTTSQHYRTFYTRKEAEAHLKEIEDEYPNAGISEMPMKEAIGLRDGLDEAVWWDKAKYRMGAVGERSPDQQEIRAVTDLMKELLKGSPNGHVIDLEAFYKTLPAAVGKSVRKYLPSIVSVGASDLGTSLLWPKGEDGKYDKTRLIVAHRRSRAEDIGVFPTGPTVVEEIGMLFEKKCKDDDEDEEEEDDDAEDEVDGIDETDEPKLTLGSKVKWGSNDDWVVDDIQDYDHKAGGVPKTITLRRTLIVDPKKRFKDEAEFKRNVPAKDVKVLWSPKFGEGATPGARSKGTGYGKSETSRAGEFWDKHDKQDKTPERKGEFNKAQRAGKKKHIDAQMRGEGSLSSELEALLNES